MVDLPKVNQPCRKTNPFRSWSEAARIPGFTHFSQHLLSHSVGALLLPKIHVLWSRSGCAALESLFDSWHGSWGFKTHRWTALSVLGKPWDLSGYGACYVWWRCAIRRGCQADTVREKMNWVTHKRQVTGLHTQPFRNLSQGNSVQWVNQCNILTGSMSHILLLQTRFARITTKNIATYAQLF